MESFDHLICDKRVKSITTSSNALATSSQFATHRRAMVQASLSTVFGRKGRHMSGTFCLTGDTMEGIIQCLVFLKAFSVSWAGCFLSFHDNQHKPPFESKTPGKVMI